VKRVDNLLSEFRSEASMSTDQIYIPTTDSCQGSASRPGGSDGTPIMSLSLTSHADVAAITISGELDLSTTPLLTELVERVVARDRPVRVVVDLAGVTFFGATGVDALLLAHDTVAAAGGRLLLRAPSPCTQKVLTITDADRLFELDTSDAAS
jgi:anti-anti-sigma factor